MTPADMLAPDFNGAWEAFQRLNTLRLAETTLESEWTHGRSEYLAFLVPIEDTVVRKYMSRIVDRIAGIPGVEPYPEGYWHITIKGLGFRTQEGAGADEVSPAGVDRIAAAARSVFSDTAAFEVRAGRVSGFPEVVILEVWDSLPVRDLNCALLDRIPGLLRYPFDGPVFLPHISIARFTSSDGLVQLKAAITSLRREEPGPPFMVRRADLIRAHLSAGATTFETIEQYPLRGRDRR